MGGMPPSHANTTLPGCCGDGPGFAASGNRVERHVGLKEAFSGRGGAVVGDFDEDGSGKPNSLASGDDEARFLNKFHGLPFGVASDGLVQPLIGDRRAVRMTSWH